MFTNLFNRSKSTFSGRRENPPALRDNTRILCVIGDDPRAGSSKFPENDRQRVNYMIK